MKTNTVLLTYLCAFGLTGFYHVSSEELTRRKGFFSVVLKAGGAVSMISRASGLTFEHGGFIFTKEGAR